MMVQFFLVSLTAFLFACSPANSVIDSGFLGGIRLDRLNSKVTVSDAQIISGGSSNITLTTRDQNGAIFKSSVPLLVAFSAFGGTSTGTLSAVTDHGDGTYTATFTGMNNGTPTTILNQIDGKDMSGLSPTVQVNSANFSLSNSTLAVSANTVSSGSNITATLTARDSSNQVLSSGGLNVFFSSTGGTSSGTFGAVTDHHDGTYSVVFSGVGAGTATSIRASIYGSNLTSVLPTVAVSAGVPASIAVSLGNSQTAAHATLLPTAFVAIVKDANANVVPAVAVTWTVTAGGGSLSSITTSTSASGLVTATLTLGLAPGTQTVTATVNSTAFTTSFDATGTTTAMTSNIWNLISSNSSNFEYDHTQINFAGPANACQLIPTSQTDSTSTHFSTGTSIGVAWDATNTYLRLGSNGSCDGTADSCAPRVVPLIYEHDSSWTPQWANMVGYWKLNGNGNDFRAALGTTQTGGVTYNNSSKIGSQAAQFDGIDDALNLTDATITYPTQSMSAAGWFKANSAGTGEGGLFKTWQWSGAWAGVSSFYITLTSTHTLSIESSTSTGAWLALSTTTTYRDDQWHHFAAVRDTANSLMNLYVDGKLMASAADSRTGSFNLTPGHSIVTIGQATGFFRGLIDDVGHWNTALTATDVQSIYNHQSVRRSGVITSRPMNGLAGASFLDLGWSTTLPFLKELPDYASSTLQNENSTSYSSQVGSTGLTGVNDLMSTAISLWHLNEITLATGGAGKDFKDDSGNGNWGVANGTITLGLNGRLGKAPDLNGSSGYISTTQSSVNPTSYTLSAWFNTTSIKGGRIIGFGDSQTGTSTTFDRQVYMQNNGTLSFGVAPTSGTAVISSSSGYNDGKWHHVVASSHGTTGITLYVDGKSVATHPAIGGQNYTGYWRVGYDSLTSWTNAPTSNYFAGLIDEVAIWSSALHSSEVTQLYRRGANRIKFQVRSCATANAGLTDCTDDATGANWKGPDGTTQSYYSELNNLAAFTSGAVKPSAPIVTFANFASSTPAPNQYFQYRAILESDDNTITNCSYDNNVTTTWCSPELKSVSVGPIHYDKNSPTVISKTGIAYYSLSSAIQSLGAGGCTSGVLYHLGFGATYDVATWYGWNGTAWVSAAGGTTSTASTFASLTASSNAALNAFGALSGSNGMVYLRAFLQSTGTSACEISALQLDGLR